MADKVNKKPAPKKWYIVDLKGKVLGRAATEIANVLRGKDQPTYAHDADNGSFVVVINASELVLTGNKLKQKTYYKYTGFPGGIKSIDAEHAVKIDPEMMVTTAVKGMLPRNTLARKLIKKLKIYPGSVHPHAAQQPVEIKV